MKKGLKKISGQDSQKLSLNSSFQSYCPENITYAKLVRLFGKPSLISPDSKVQVKWVLVTANGSIATIYDYKARRPVEEIKGSSWHIGGHGFNVAVKKVLALLA